MLADTPHGSVEYEIAGEGPPVARYAGIRSPEPERVDRGSRRVRARAIAVLRGA